MDMANFFFKDTGKENLKKGEEYEPLSISNINIPIDAKEKEVSSPGKKVEGSTEKKSETNEENRKNSEEHALNPNHLQDNANDNHDHQQGNKQDIQHYEEKTIDLQQQQDNNQYKSYNEETANLQKGQQKANDVIDDGNIVYNPDQFPPDLRLCHAHEMASRVSFPIKPQDGKKIDVCECCGQPVVNTLVPLNIDYRDLEEFGVGIPLYFQFLIKAIILSFLGLVIFGVYILYDNHKGSNCISIEYENTPLGIKLRDSLCFKRNLKELTYYNKLDMKDRENVRIQSWLSLGCCAILIIFIQLVRIDAKKLEVECDIGATTGSDYTILVSNLPGGNYTKEELEQVLKNWASKSTKSRERKRLKSLIGDEITIERILPGFKLAEYIELSKTKKKLVEERKKSIAEKQKQENNAETFKDSDIQKKIDDVAKQLDKIEDKALSGSMDDTTNYAFVTFSKATEALLFVRFYKLSILSRTFHKFRELINRPPIFANNHMVLKNRVLWVSRAAEPDDVLWKNLPFSDSYKIKMRIKAAIINTVILSICLAGIFGLSYLQKKLTNDNKQSSSIILILIQILNTAISLIILFINSVLKSVITYLGKLEKHSSMATYNGSVSKRLCFATFANTAITPLIANLYASDSNLLYVAGGLIDNIFFILISNAISMPLLLLINPEYYLKLFNRYNILREKEKCLKTQSEANGIFEDLNLDLSVKYPAIVRTLWVTLFYASLIPTGLIFTTAGFCLYYFIDKFSFLRRTAKPPSMGATLNLEMIELLEYCPLFLSGGNLLFTYLLFNSQPGKDNFEILDNKGDLIALGLSVLILLFPMAKIQALICKRKSTFEEFQNLYQYKQARYIFPTDYDRTNPLTHDKALANWIDLVENHGVDFGQDLKDKINSDKEKKMKKLEDKKNKNKKKEKKKDNTVKDSKKEEKQKAKDGEHSKKSEKKNDEKKDKKKKDEKKDKKKKDENKSNGEVVFQKVEVIDEVELQKVEVIDEVELQKVEAIDELEVKKVEVIDEAELQKVEAIDEAVFQKLEIIDESDHVNIEIQGLESTARLVEPETQNENNDKEKNDEN